MQLSESENNLISAESWREFWKAAVEETDAHNFQSRRDSTPTWVRFDNQDRKSHAGHAGLPFSHLQETGKGRVAKILESTIDDSECKEQAVDDEPARFVSDTSQPSFERRGGVQFDCQISIDSIEFSETANDGMNEVATDEKWKRKEWN